PGAHRLVGGAIGPPQAQRLLGPLDVAALQVTAREARHRLGMARLVLQHMGIGLRRLADVAGRERLLGHRDDLFRVARSAMAVALAGKPGHELTYLAFGDHADEAVYRLA